ncbi:class I SAM-dependent methyltransferase [Rhodocyclus tenuis]|uniref:class I SAM-dependent methyltransferase n=1 Tax=Rhodocyclus tenuis TaxID=1066 RepID=UPI0019078B25|nr:methyltransferase domain-containing protein [Rhodocyclus tenuis]MBK1678904.1 hypothetical protein [Rhodocyclus tenuis]
MARLHFGSFNCPIDGWINTDVTPHLYIAKVPGLASLLHKLGKMTDERFSDHRNGAFRKVRYLNVTRPWPYADATFEAIGSSHVVEHLPLHGAKVCLAESFRCLQPGGVLRISVPDLDDYIAKFHQEDPINWATKFFEADQVSEKNMHHFMYNFESMRSLLQSLGFSSVTRQEYQQGICPDLEKLDNRPASLFVEAIK